MHTAAPIDRLSGILERFRVQAQLHHTGALCGLSHFDACDGHGYLHVLRRGTLEVSHPGAHEVPASLRLQEPTLLLYPRPFDHEVRRAAQASRIRGVRMAHPRTKAHRPDLEERGVRRWGSLG